MCVCIELVHVNVKHQIHYLLNYMYIHVNEEGYLIVSTVVRSVLYVYILESDTVFSPPSTQHSTTFTKKMIEDNSTMDETAQFLGVSTS